MGASPTENIPQQPVLKLNNSLRTLSGFVFLFVVALFVIIIFKFLGISASLALMIALTLRIGFNLLPCLKCDRTSGSNKSQKPPSCTATRSYDSADYVSATSTVMRGLLIFCGFVPGYWGNESGNISVGGCADFACWIDGGIRTTGKWLIRCDRFLCLWA